MESNFHYGTVTEFGFPFILNQQKGLYITICSNHLKIRESSDRGGLNPALLSELVRYPEGSNWALSLPSSKFL
jgi:hypothetical protein